MIKFVLVTFAIITLFTFGVAFYKKTKPNLNFQPNPTQDTSKKIDKSASLFNIFSTGLEIPWSMVFLPDGRILVTERPGRVRLVNSNGDLITKPVLVLEDVKTTGESGLHGITLHPKFNQNKFVYLYYTYSIDGNNTLNKVVKFLYENGQLIKPQVIVENIPGANIHDGGRIGFGPDNFLYITTGDAAEPSLSQNTNSLAGKILRVTDEGKPAPANPFNNLIYSYGHRNPQGMAWDNQGNLYATEHGQSATDELNLVEVGNNYGWPTIRAGQKQNGLVSPIIQSGQETWAPSGMAFYKGFLFFGGLRGQTLYQVKIVSKDKVELKTHFSKQFGRIRDVILGPDNMLYLTTSNRDGRGNPSPGDDKIIKVDPEKLVNEG